MAWLVYRLTGSELLLGTVAFCSQIPAFLMSPVAGVVADKHDRRKLLMITQSLGAVEAFILAFLVLSNLIQPWHIVLTSVFIGIVNAFDMPTRQALVPQLVEDKAILPNAIALNSTQFNIARLIGPALAGVTVAAVGEGWCFLINGVSFACVLIALKMMHLEPPVIQTSSEKPISRLKAGAVYAWNHEPIRALLQLMALTSLVSGSYTVLLPVIAKSTFHGSSVTYSLLSSGVAVGALFAAYSLARRRSVVGLTRWIVQSALVFNLSLAALAFTGNFYVSLPVLAFLGFGIMRHMGSTNTLIQTLVDDSMRGRVMSFYMMSFVGTMPIGSLAGGAISDAIGTEGSLLISATVGLCGVAAFYFALPKIRKVLRPIYEQMGILEPVS